MNDVSTYVFIFGAMVKLVDTYLPHVLLYDFTIRYMWLFCIFQNAGTKI